MGEDVWEVGHGHAQGFWLSSDQNAHLYYKDGYYIYIKPTKSGIEIYQRFNSHIHKDTEDKSRLLFGAPLKGLVAELGGFKDKWIGGIPGGYRLKSTAPAEFFAGPLELIRKVHQ